MHNLRLIHIVIFHFKNDVLNKIVRIFKIWDAAMIFHKSVGETTLFCKLGQNSSYNRYIFFIKMDDTFFVFQLF